MAASKRLAASGWHSPEMVTGPGAAKGRVLSGAGNHPAWASSSGLGALHAKLVHAIAHSLEALSSRPASVGVALSGGADSAMLAVHAQQFAAERGIQLHLFHIHHGLQAIADSWQEHTHRLALQLGVPCHSLRVRVALESGLGMEAAARDARYQGLASLARGAGVRVVLLAHHLDDQAETVLLQLLRGAGPAGMGAMAPLIQRDGLCYLRPWLGIQRADILKLAAAYAKSTGWHPVNDPTNVADHYTRGAVRERLVPHLNERWPAWRSTLARHARLSRETAEVLDEVAAADFQGLDPADAQRSFSLAGWRQLSAARQALVLRYWLGLHSLPMPTEARLAELMRQLRELHALGHDRHMRLRHAGIHIVCVRGRVGLEDTLKPDSHAKNR